MSVNTPLVGTFISFGTPVANGVLSFVLTNCGGSPTFGSLTPGPFTLSAGGVLAASIAGNQATGCSEASVGVNNSYYEVSLQDSSMTLLWRRSFQIPVQTASFNLATATPVSSIPEQVIKTGAPGAAATIVVGNVSELAPGDAPTINNEGTSSAAIIDFGIPGSGGSEGAVAPPFGIISATVTDPTTLTPANGDAYLLLAGGSGAWSGQTNSIALWSISSWIFFTPKLGETVYNKANDLYLYWDGEAWGIVEDGPTGTVTSIGLSAPSRFTVTGSPVISSGTIAISDNVQTHNVIFAGPVSGASAAPTFRALVPTDVPVLNQDTTGNAAFATTSSSAASAADALAIDGVVVTGVAASGQVITAVTPTTATWETPQFMPLAPSGNTSVTVPAASTFSLNIPSTSSTAGALKLSVPAGGTGISVGGVITTSAALLQQQGMLMNSVTVLNSSNSGQTPTLNLSAASSFYRINASGATSSLQIFLPAQLTVGSGLIPVDGLTLNFSRYDEGGATTPPDTPSQLVSLNITGSGTFVEPAISLSATYYLANTESVSLIANHLADGTLIYSVVASSKLPSISGNVLFASGAVSSSAGTAYLVPSNSIIKRGNVLLTTTDLANSLVGVLSILPRVGSTRGPSDIFEFSVAPGTAAGVVVGSLDWYQPYNSTIGVPPQQGVLVYAGDTLVLRFTSGTSGFSGIVAFGS